MNFDKAFNTWFNIITIATLYIIVPVLGMIQYYSTGNSWWLLCWGMWSIPVAYLILLASTHPVLLYKKVRELVKRVIC